MVFLIFLIAKLNGENGYLKDIEAPIFFRVNLKTIKNYLKQISKFNILTVSTRHDPKNQNVVAETYISFNHNSAYLINIQKEYVHELQNIVSNFQFSQMEKEKMNCLINLNN